MRFEAFGEIAAGARDKLIAIIALHLVVDGDRIAGFWHDVQYRRICEAEDSWREASRKARKFPENIGKFSFSRRSGNLCDFRMEEL